MNTELDIDLIINYWLFQSNGYFFISNSTRTKKINLDLFENVSICIYDTKYLEKFTQECVNSDLYFTAVSILLHEGLRLYNRSWTIISEQHIVFKTSCTIDHPQL